MHDENKPSDAVSRRELGGETDEPNTGNTVFYVIAVIAVFAAVMIALSLTTK